MVGMAARPGASINAGQKYAAPPPVSSPHWDLLATRPASTLSEYAQRVRPATLAQVESTRHVVMYVIRYSSFDEFCSLANHYLGKMPSITQILPKAKSLAARSMSRKPQRNT